MYRHMDRHVRECRARGFEGTSVEALAGGDWTANHLELLRPISKGGLILFGGHGSASGSCLVNIEDLVELGVGPSIVINGSCYGATTHRIIEYGYGMDRHR